MPSVHSMHILRPDRLLVHSLLMVLSGDSQCIAHWGRSLAFHLDT